MAAGMNAAMKERTESQMHPAIRKMINRYGVTPACLEYLAEEPRQYIGGQFTIGNASDRIDVIEPSTGCLLTTIASGTNADVDDAVAAAGCAEHHHWQGQNDRQLPLRTSWRQQGFLHWFHAHRPDGWLRGRGKPVTGHAGIGR